MPLSFTDFLKHVADIREEISSLSAYVQEAEKTSRYFVPISEENSTHKKVNVISVEFHGKAKKLNTRIEALAKSCKEETDNKESRMHHVKSLFTMLSKKTTEFTAIRAEIARKAEEKSEEYQEQSASLPASATGSPALHSSLEKQTSIEEIVNDLKSLEALSIELNNIVDSAGAPLDKISLKAFETRVHSNSTNTEFERTIRRRKRSRVRKYLLLLLLVIAGTVAGCYFSDIILNFIIKVRGAFGSNTGKV